MTGFHDAVREIAGLPRRTNVALHGGIGPNIYLALRAAMSSTHADMTAARSALAGRLANLRAKNDTSAVVAVKRAIALLDERMIGTGHFVRDAAGVAPFRRAGKNSRFP